MLRICGWARSVAGENWKTACGERARKWPLWHFTWSVAPATRKTSKTYASSADTSINATVRSDVVVTPGFSPGADAATALNPSPAAHRVVVPGAALCGWLAPFTVMVLCASVDLYQL